MAITLPFNFKARPYQREVFDADKAWKKRFLLVWHRRAWKDKCVLQLLIKWALEDVWVYYYVFPEYNQWRKVFWDGIDNDGFRNINHIPKELFAKQPNEQQMKIELINGSIIQVVGTDKKIDNIVGTNIKWAIFSEYPISNPKWWDLIRPILTANGWKAAFVYTPRGKNHWYKLYQAALSFSEKWFVSMKTIKDTVDNNWDPIVTQEMIDDERRSWMDEDLIQQEYYCSFDASIKWAYYAEQMRSARQEWRISNVAYESNLEVHTFWDLGINDTTAIWFVQIYGKEARIIDHYESSWEGLEHYVNIIKSKEYKYWTHYLPHDVEVRELQTGQSRKQYLESLWMNNLKVVPRLWVEEWIDAVRRTLKNCWFDEKKCERGINALTDYHKEYDDKNHTFRNSPKHDWASNSADAFRYFAVTYKEITTLVEDEETIIFDYSSII